MTKKGENPIRRSQRKRGRPALESNSVTSPEVNNNSPNMNKSFVVISSKNDCGVWVATWMERGEVKKYDNIEVSNYTRLSLAAKIGLHSYNLLQGMVLTKSLDYYHRLLEADKKKKAVPRTC